MRHLIARAAALAAATAAIALPAAAAAAGGPPVLSWTPATAGGYSYGTLTAGHTAATTFTLANSGGSASAALTITLTGPAAFAKTADTCTGTSLGPGKTCTVTVAYTAPAVPGQAATATLTATGIKAAATAALTLAGAAAKTTPAITTASSPGGTVGATVTDTATLTGGYQPTGTIEFKLYPGPGCTGTPADDETVKVTGNGTYTTPASATPAAGSYSWTAAYTGDPANNAAATACGTDTVTIGKAAPAITTASSPGGTAGTTVTDTATLSGGYQPTGTIEFKLYPTTDCSGSPVDDETVTVNGNGTYTTPAGATPAQAGTYTWTAAYTGDANNAAAATTCGTDTVTLTKATPTITITQLASPGDQGECGELGNPCIPATDTATLSGGDQPTGTIEFQLYGPESLSPDHCSGTPVADETVTITGDGAYTTPTGYVPIPNFANGTPDDQYYFWTASYSGDGANNPVTTGCTIDGSEYYGIVPP